MRYNNACFNPLLQNNKTVVMDKKDITELSQRITDLANIPNECDKDNCQYNSGSLCCKVGSVFIIEKLITKGIEEGIRNGATSLPNNPNDKSKYNVTLQHDGHNELDRMNDALYGFDKFNKETKAPHQNYVAAEYFRSAVKKMRYILNEMYLNNKTP